MDPQIIIKQENQSIEQQHLLNPNNPTFDTYINSEYLDGNNVSIDSLVNQETNLQPVSNQEMMDYLMNTIFTGDPNLNGAAMQPQFFPMNNAMLPTVVDGMSNSMEMGSPVTSTTMESEAVPSNKKRSNNKATEKSKYAESNIPRSDLVFSQEDLDLIEKAGPKERRQIRNKVSARNFRLRRKEYINGLEEKARTYDDNLAALNQELSNCQREKISLILDVEDLINKFQLLTTEAPELEKYSGLDPLRDLTIYQGKLVLKNGNRGNTATNQGNMLSCRRVSNFEGNKQGGDSLSDNQMSNRFQGGNGQNYMVKA